ncbi:hypothetical protein [Brevifollis gellanilyticus]|uniref:Nucleotidyltransferase n=1 Tax=Brevifollis gellanilyticus TaxID=748831 RepID=A0A512MHX7_9BACT|nr:hypothetical protein [Brevifollis gellanilyticus]GEP46345.1 hypothetical protein BGE01nite_56360 [Brevifollis gellanilyticus]
MREHQVRCLLMGGQACVLYGAAEFSRDTDLVILASEDNAERLTNCMSALDAEVIAVPPFLLQYLEAGHAVHFRCQHPDAAGMRVDVMSRMRGVPDFQTLWERRTTLEMDDGTLCDVLSLPDLVRAKKTQRDKDWPMIRRLVEANYFANHTSPTPQQLAFWFEELRTPELLLALSQAHPQLATDAERRRGLIVHAISGDLAALTTAMEHEERQERLQDQAYWQPLKRELESLRRGKPMV